MYESSELNAGVYGSGKGQADLEMKCPRIVRDYPPPGPSPCSSADDSRRLFGVLFLLFSEDVCPWKKQQTLSKLFLNYR